MLPSKLAFIDIETTGARVFRDRIIEIGVLRVEEGEVVKTYQTLVNPEQYLPVEITSLTGITSVDINKAPLFSEVKEAILDIVKDCVLVGHNVRFDYGFIRQELRNCDIAFSAKQICTVKLSRALFPSYVKHNLDSLIERFSLSCDKRHRAFDDAKVIWDFYRLLLDIYPKEKVENVIKTILQTPSYPVHVKHDVLENLPESFGVYTFYGEEGLPLYIGKSINVRKRILSHFSNDQRSPLDTKLVQQAYHIEILRTEGELGALLKESELIKSMQPLFNRKLRIKQRVVMAKQVVDEKGYYCVALEDRTYINTDDMQTFLGIFPSKKRANIFLQAIAKRYNLCERKLGIEKTLKQCFAYRLGNCFGACSQKEEAIRYNMRFVQAFSEFKIKPWPFQGPILIKEQSLPGKTIEYFLVDKWCFLGKIKRIDDVFYDSSQEHLLFDLDTYYILCSYLRNKKNFNNIIVLKPKNGLLRRGHTEVFEQM